MRTKKDAQGSLSLNGKGINAADTSYAGKVMWSLAVSSQPRSQEHHAPATVGKHVLGLKYVPVEQQQRDSRSQCFSFRLQHGQNGTVVPQMQT